jgi:hypothetical protein
MEYHIRWTIMVFQLVVFEWSTDQLSFPKDSIILMPKTYSWMKMSWNNFHEIHCVLNWWNTTENGQWCIHNKLYLNDPLISSVSFKMELFLMLSKAYSWMKMSWTYFHEKCLDYSIQKTTRPLKQHITYKKLEQTQDNTNTHDLVIPYNYHGYQRTSVLWGFLS